MSLLEARDVQVTLGSRSIIREVNLAIEPGQVLGVLGPTGAGKTTLFKVLVGELRPCTGLVWFDGMDVTKLALWNRARLGIGYIPQTPSVLVDLDVRRNLQSFEKLVAATRKGPDYWAQQVGLEHRLEVRAGNLSGGERRLLELARSLIGGPKALICDEPFAGMDPLAAGMVAKKLRDLADSGIAVLVSDHHALIALSICDRAGLVLNGRLYPWKTPDEWQCDELVRQCYLGHYGDARHASQVVS